MEGNCILVFQTTHRTLEAENVLKREKVKIKIVLKPRSITTDCGLAIQFDCGKKEIIADIIKNNNLIFVGIYQKTQEGWVEINEGSGIFDHSS